jgi:murein DD-endopeptidase MepM/ murein hydrolase activator NlpD
LRRIIYILSISCIGISGLNASPGFIPGDDKKGKATAKKDDTTRYVVNPELPGEEETPDTSVITFPSHDLYSTWDINAAHPYNFNESFKEDSVVINLVGDNDHEFVLPYRGELTSLFGWRKYRPHYGTDIGLRTGDSVLAAFDGMVRIAKYFHGYGNCVIIRHNNGLETVYAHLSKILVESGQTIIAGDLIGKGGNTGHSFGSHLHFEIRFLGQALDPQDFINYETGTLKSREFVLRKSDVENKYDLRALHYRHRHDLGLGYHKRGKGGSRVYVVRKGDCLAAIAKRHRTTVVQLRKKNRLRASSKLQIGQRLIL